MTRDTSDEHCFAEPDGQEGFLYVREWEDRRLIEEFRFLTSLYATVASEVAFRADHPDQRDGTADIRAKDVRLYELCDIVESRGRTYADQLGAPQP